MVSQEIARPTWKFSGLKSGNEREAALVAYWELDLVTITDDYSPDEIVDRELFEIWVKKVEERYPNGLIPIDWYVVCKEEGVLERMPFQFDPSASEQRDFLGYFTWPQNSSTGETLNWLTLPVEDRLWDSGHGDKGGFLQSATGWKPSVLQPYLYLPSLIAAVENS